MNRRAPAAGFTLIEILLAVALMGGLLLALNMFVFSMGEIWGQNADQRLFDQHVRAVTRHVDGLFRRAALAAGADSPVAPAEIRAERGNEALLTFELPAGDRTLPWPESPLPDVVCSLEAREGRGLVLYWHSRLETRFEDDPPRATLLTPLAVGLSYDYYDDAARSWRTQDRLQKDNSGNWQTPARVTLRFAHGNLKAETTLVLPVATDGMPQF
jgi:prepilin-type N-terminal cleavage/methylation domain-containing protein